MASEVTDPSSHEHLGGIASRGAVGTEIAADADSDASLPEAVTRRDDEGRLLSTLPRRDPVLLPRREPEFDALGDPPSSIDVHACSAHDLVSDTRNHLSHKGQARMSVLLSSNRGTFGSFELLLVLPLPVLALELPGGERPAELFEPLLAREPPVRDPPLHRAGSAEVLSVPGDADRAPGRDVPVAGACASAVTGAHSSPATIDSFAVASGTASILAAARRFSCERDSAIPILATGEHASRGASASALSAGGAPLGAPLVTAAGELGCSGPGALAAGCASENACSITSPSLRGCWLSARG
jgi:hypothetical protein